ncbi:hypothetical protein LJ739_14000 [Aestuariibacter halophilus]|uniref:Secreted protein n=1 Tax=Fluctibacter halophilus TaxID=226011 RepID=A0ABS8GA04_9ALTE|nr:hypothetical protein [Aestuariibacter halophilus]MCC2617360.1 hypothetical protein [Aestuariibacter halophilus]
MTLIRHLTQPAARHSLALVLLCVFATTSQADNYGEEAQKACDHMRTCARQQLADVPAEFRQMIEQTLDGMCESMPGTDDIPGFGAQHQLYAPAVACMKSISALSCEEIEAGHADTAECQRLQDMYGEHSEG